MKVIIAILCLLIICGVFSCCKHEGRAPLAFISPSVSTNAALAFTKELPENASLRTLVEKLDVIMLEIRRARHSDMPSIYESIKILRTQPEIVKALTSYYKSITKEDYVQRRFTIQVIGELRRQDALPFLCAVVWNSLPAEETSVSLTSRDYEEIIMTKAVYGITYLRDEEGFKETIMVMLEHESTAVRIAAIDAYMWNLRDGRQAAATLYKLLPEAFHKYVERPRFYKGMDYHEFNNRLEAWLNTWGEEY